MWNYPNLSDDKTRVLKYPNPTGSLSKPVEGELLGNIYGYTTKGIAQSHDEMVAHLEELRDRRIELGLPLLGSDGLGGQSDGGLGRGLTAGDIMYEDINGDGSIDTGDNTIYDMGDYKVIGNTTPRFQTALRLDMAWKGIDLSLFFQGVLKRDYYPDDPGGGSGQDLDMLFWGATRGGVSFSTVFKEHLDYWRDETSPLGANYDAYYPRPLFNLRNQRPQTRYLQDASYLRLKNVQLGYTLPQKWTKVIGIERFRIFGTAENLLTFTKMSKLLDPEVAGYNNKMKKYIKYAGYVYLFFLLVGCDGLLDTEPKSIVTPANYLKDESHLMAYITNYYTSDGYSQESGMLDCHNSNPSGSAYWRDTKTDNEIGRNGNTRFLPGELKVSATGGAWTFSNIRALNYYLETVVPRYEAGEITGNPTNVRHYIGEGYFLRAHEYFYRLRELGDFPIIKNVLPDVHEELVVASRRSPRNEVARFIIADLDTAISMLTNTLCC